jgi:hypothetical protein
MKSISKLIIFIFTFLALAASAYAQSPREELQQMVQKLQKTPSDNALREKIIKLAPTLHPSPALPDTAIAFEGRAQFAYKNAKSEGDFLAAAREYEKAVAVAPWVPGYYSDLCMIYEKAGKYEDAKRHCGFYLIGLTDPAQMTDVKRRIAGLEFGIEKANSPAAQADRERDEFAIFLRQNEGAIFNTAPASGKYNDGNYVQATIENGAVVIGIRYVNEDWLSLNPQCRGKLWDPTRYAVKGFTDSVNFICGPDTTCLKTFTFSRDGRTITTSFMQRGATNPFVQVFRRVN